MGRLPEAYIAPPPVRALRELVRHRAEADHVGARGARPRSTRCWPSAASPVPMSDLFGPSGARCSMRCAGVPVGRVDQQFAVGAGVRRTGRSLRMLLDVLQTEIARVRPAGSPPRWPVTRVTARCSRSAGSDRCSPRCSSPRSVTSPGSPPPTQLTLLGRADPAAPRVRHHGASWARSPSRAPSWSAGPRSRPMQRSSEPAGGADPHPDRRPPSPARQRTGRNIAKVAARPGAAQARLLRAARRSDPRTELHLGLPPRPRPAPAGRPCRGRTSGMTGDRTAPGRQTHTPARSRAPQAGRVIAHRLTPAPRRRGRDFD